MLQPNFDPAPGQPFASIAANTFRSAERAVASSARLVAEKVDTAGRHVRQIELCLVHCQIVIERERERGPEISDRRNEKGSEQLSLRAPHRDH